MRSLLRPPLRSSPLPSLSHVPSASERATSARLAALTSEARQRALVEVRVRDGREVADREAEHGIAEKFQRLVVATVGFLARRAVDEGADEQVAVGEHMPDRGLE